MRNYFIECVATRERLIYRLYHRPTGEIVELHYPRPRRPEPFKYVARELYRAMDLTLMLREEENEEGPFHAPAA